LQQTSAIRDWVFYKNSLPIVWFTAWADIPLHVKKLAVMVNGTTYAKKIEVEHKKRK
jgi:hypothetical protein